MWYFEHNYVALMNMICEFDLMNHAAIEFSMTGNTVRVTLVERTRYTLLIRIRQQFQPAEKFLPDLCFDIRLYLDARLAEVISYQGVRRLDAKYPYPNKGMHHPDEKQQTNLILYDWLSTCSRLNFSQATISKITPLRIPT